MRSDTKGRIKKGFSLSRKQEFEGKVMLRDKCIPTVYHAEIFPSKLQTKTNRELLTNRYVNTGALPFLISKFYTHEKQSGIKRLFHQ